MSHPGKPESHVYNVCCFFVKVVSGCFLLVVRGYRWPSHPGSAAFACSFMCSLQRNPHRDHPIRHMLKATPPTRRRIRRRRAHRRQPRAFGRIVFLVHIVGQLIDIRPVFLAPARMARKVMAIAAVRCACPAQAGSVSPCWGALRGRSRGVRAWNPSW